MVFCLIQLWLILENGGGPFGDLAMESVENLNSELDQLRSKLDTCRMAEMIRDGPKQIMRAGRVTLPCPAPRRYRNVVVAGLGGSALPADVMADCFRGSIRRPVSVHRGYGLPPDFDSETLAICCSFSGNTEETLDTLNHLASVTGNVITMGSGGQLEAVSRERRIPFIRIPAEPPDLQPRCATGYFLTFLVRILEGECLPEGSAARLEAAAEHVDVEGIRRQAERCASLIDDRIPVVYTEEGHLLGIARVGKIKFNENAKRPAFFNAFPELNHNEMIGFSHRLGRYCVLYLHDPASDPRIRQRFEAMRQLFGAEGMENVTFFEWVMPGESRIDRVLSSLCFLDWCSYTCALLSGYDPTPVELTERFKAALASQLARRE
jgi:glucose/mannose-6-phosphate isomerase